MMMKYELLNYVVAQYYIATYQVILRLTSVVTQIKALAKLHVCNELYQGSKKGGF
jgi:hypothetical protein